MNLEEQIRQDLENFSKENGGLYQKFADKYPITRQQAKNFLYPFLYGARPDQIKPLITPEEATKVLADYKNLETRLILGQS